MTPIATATLRPDVGRTTWTGRIAATPTGSVACSPEQGITAVVMAAGFLPGTFLGVALAAAELEEAENPGWGTRLTDTGGIVRWDGGFTRGRWMEYDRSAGVLTWDTGTGHPSGWLGAALVGVGLARLSRRDLAAWRGNLDPETAGAAAALAVLS